MTGEPLNVLLVDDSPTVGKAIGRMLEGLEGCSFVYCQEPRQALETASSVQPTVLLLDLTMPGVDGLTLLAEFRQRPEFGALPIVVLSGKESPEVKARAFAAGANDYLVKLPSATELVARVEYHTRAFLRDSMAEALRLKERELREHNQRLEALTQELRAAHQEALQASRAKSAFLANMSHEIRTPMNAIIGLTNLCLEGELNPTQRDFLHNVSRSADALLRIINDILDLSKIEAGLLDFDPHPFSLRDVLDQVAGTQVEQHENADRAKLEGHPAGEDLTGENQSDACRDRDECSRRDDLYIGIAGKTLQPVELRSVGDRRSFCKKQGHNHQPPDPHAERSDVEHLEP